MLSAIIDRIDGNQARVTIGNDSVGVAIPLSDLPPNAHEGMVMRVRFTLDQAATNAHGARPTGRKD